MPFERLDEAQARIDEAARAAERDPRAVTRIAQLPGRIDPQDHGPARADAPLVGPPKRWISTIEQLLDELCF